MFECFRGTLDIEPVHGAETQMKTIRKKLDFGDPSTLEEEAVCFSEM
jgi:hypothetical protein